MSISDVSQSDLCLGPCDTDGADGESHHVHFAQRKHAPLARGAWILFYCRAGYASASVYLSGLRRWTWLTRPRRSIKAYILFRAIERYRPRLRNAVFVLSQ